MGSLRLLLALAVVIAHTQPIAGFPIIGGALAVQLFFVVSGFYMGLILTERYHGNLKSFYANRFLRLYPLYWTVLALELTRVFVLWQLAVPPPTWLASIQQAVAANDLATAMLPVYALSQISLVGIDFMHLLSWTETGGLAWHGAGAAQAEAVRGWRLFPMSHAWALSAEVFFYALAPFINRLSTARLAFLGLVATGSNLGLHFAVDPSLASVATSFFGPFQLGYFILGLLSYRLYRQHQTRMSGWSVGFLTITALVLVLFGKGLLQQWSYTGSLVILWTVAFVSVPCLFVASKKSRLDRALGELSYPVYLVHMSVARTVGPYFNDLEATVALPSWLYPVSVMVISIGISLLLNRLVGLWIDRKRERIRQRVIRDEPKRIQAGF